MAKLIANIAATLLRFILKGSFVLEAATKFVNVTTIFILVQDNSTSAINTTI